LFLRQEKMAGHSDIFHHVRDSAYLELPHFINDGKLPLPKIGDFQITKFMALQLVAGLLTLLVGWGLARRASRGGATKGRIWNFFEAIAVYLRDEVVRPTIGDGHSHAEEHVDSHGHVHHGHEPSHHEPRVTEDHGHGGPASLHHAGHPADRFLPFIWTVFFYVLFCNLLGAIPFLGSPTGDINVTAALALTAFAATFLAGVSELGFVGFWKNLVPPLDAPGWMKVALIPLMFLIEVVGLFIKHGVLAVRLFANIMGGHTVIGVMLAFIAADAVISGPLWYLVTPAAILGQVGIGLLELFVAFLQAYVFAVLATIFIGMGSHPH
jgi:F-type H+-transporting ATPase subunit a